MSATKIVSIPSNVGFGDHLPSMPSFPSFGISNLPSYSTHSHIDSSPVNQLQATPPLPNTPVCSTPGIDKDAVITQPNTPNAHSTPGQKVSALTEATAQQYDVASWLQSLGLAAYTDSFHHQGIYYMYQLQDFSLEASGVQ
ncbi:hypothetical protein LSH36_52g04006 [Paralvinella palmiformis]|uniref:SAM domain-containing protein n=1 Tax=Paralvinella palmiformis TaxID=53620 RepID=A0AAD9NCT7_9ANNE|nr:hypothetical protein LSH36_52g04006 [Paralvinella palmiformis]